MSIGDFKSEFSQLLKRYAFTYSPTDGLTHQQLLDAIPETLCSDFGVNLKFVEEAALKTPSNNIYETLRSVFGVNRQFLQKVAWKPSHHNEILAAFLDSNQIGRCELFTEDEFQVANFNNLHTNLKDLDNEFPADKSCKFKKMPRSETSAVRRVSTVIKSSLKKSKNNLNSPNNIQRANVRRRYLSAKLSNPETTSKSNLVSPLTTKKQASIPNKSSQHLSSFATDKSKSPRKPARNPKYAHVQSTIPKAARYLCSKKRT